jgi:hypothetical protein
MAHPLRPTNLQGLGYIMARAGGGGGGALNLSARALGGLFLLSERPMPKPKLQSSFCRKRRSILQGPTAVSGPSCEVRASAPTSDIKDGEPSSAGCLLLSNDH